MEFNFICDTTGHIYINGMETDFKGVLSYLKANGIIVSETQEVRNVFRKSVNGYVQEKEDCTVYKIEC